MQLYWQAFLAFIKKFILRQNTGKVVCDFAKRMGVVYIKVAQILAMQNVGNLFTEADRQQLSDICDRCNPLPFAKIKHILQQEYGNQFEQVFQSIDEVPLGSASISQVHRAVLKDGTAVAIKVKRNDVTHRIEHDVRQIRKIIHRFGRFVRFRNLFGSDKALDCYLDWIYQETDFENEQHNILRYREFAENVNGRIKDIRTKIVTPKLYADLCTPNIIVMEFIPHPTINQLELTAANKAKISQAENDYIRLSFYALFHQLPVVFHGDPHGGNIYLDPAGNIGFLDMGLIFEFSPAEAELTRELFLDSYTGKVERIVDLLFQQSQFEHVDRKQLTIDMQKEIDKLHDIPVPQFFVEMIGIFTQYDIAPPQFLFKMAKAFLALFGLNTIMNNSINTKTLLAQQVTEFYLSRTAGDFQDILKSGLRLAPGFLKTTLREGPIVGISDSFSGILELSNQFQAASSHFHEVLELFGVLNN